MSAAVMELWKYVEPDPPRKERPPTWRDFVVALLVLGGLVLLFKLMGG